MVLVIFWSAIVNRLAAGTAALLALTTTPVLAADMEVKSPQAAAVYSWRGYYGGANAGYGWIDDPGRPRCFQSGVENSPGCQKRRAAPDDPRLRIHWWRAGWLQLAVQSESRGRDRD